MDSAGRTLYLSDLDGTLLGRDDRISPRSLEILNRLSAKGLCFSYATARSLSSAQVVTQGLSLKLPVIVYNGCMLLQPESGECLFSHRFTREQTARVRALAADRTPGLLVYAWIDGVQRVSWCAGTENEGLLRYLLNRKNDKRLRPVASYDALFDGEAFYFTLIGEATGLAPLYARFTQDADFTVTFQQELYRPEYWLELMPRAASKGNAARSLKQRLGFSRLVVFGDAVNDLALFAEANEAYAVKNAAAALKAQATAVIPANDADGVALWLAAHGEYTR